MSTREEVTIINRERQRQADEMIAHLEKLGVDVRIAHFTGDSSFPTEYTISYHGMSVIGPTFDLALQEWIEKLLARRD